MDVSTSVSQTVRKEFDMSPILRGVFSNLECPVGERIRCLREIRDYSSKNTGLATNQHFELPTVHRAYSLG